MDVHPFSQTAVILKEAGNTRKEMLANISDDTYINASYIKTAFNESNPNGTSDPFGLIICAQGPKRNTIKNFWKMVI